MGRIYERRRITYGVLDSINFEYYMFSTNKVHNLILETFVGFAPTEEHTADHRDLNTKNNKLTNLRWATKKEQALNKKHNILQTIEEFNGYTGELVKIYECINDVKGRSYEPTCKKDTFICRNRISLNYLRLKVVKKMFEKSNLSYKISERNKENENNHILGLYIYEEEICYKLLPSKFYKSRKPILFRKKEFTNSNTPQALAHKKRNEKFLQIYKNLSHLEYLFSDIDFNNICKEDWIKIYTNIAITNNNARIIQCYWRSYQVFKKYLE
jgi:hypothetical protein